MWSNQRWGTERHPEDFVEAERGDDGSLWDVLSSDWDLMIALPRPIQGQFMRKISCQQVVLRNHESVNHESLTPGTCQVW